MIPESLKPRIVKPVTVTFRILTHHLAGGAVCLAHHADSVDILRRAWIEARVRRRIRGRLEHRTLTARVIPSVVIATFSRCKPRTRIVVPGVAASTAAWIESPGPTTTTCTCACAVAASTSANPAERTTDNCRTRLISDLLWPGMSFTVSLVTRARSSLSVRLRAGAPPFR